ncbi:MAG TPA: permease [Streptosporangiaceae bacterium]|nr:permease [Streptosporangiaceae bacterium]
MRILHALGHALAVTGTMTWEITWSLILGFGLSAIIQALVRRQTITRLLGDDRPRTLALATGFGAASSSCSYAAVALARSLFRKGASFTSAMVFQIASTNLVIELGIILALLIGWQFTLAEYAGGVVMIVVVAVAFRLLVSRQLIDAARRQAEQGVAGSMEGHAAMDMSITAGGSFRRRLISPRGFTSVSHIFVMEWAAVIRDVVGGLLIAGAVGAWVPDSFWRHLFLAGHPLAARLWGPLIGPVISMLSFVCSIGNVPLAGVLWNGGISFGGVTAFLFADLIIIPILIIYRKYYGTRMMLAILGIFYAAMVLAGYVIEFVFGALGLIPQARTARITEHAIEWNYTTILDIIFLLVAAALLVRFFRTGGGPMLKMMDGSPDGHEHDHHLHHGQQQGSAGACESARGAL